MFTAQPLSFQYAPQRKSKVEANRYSKWMMEPLEDSSKPAALGLLQVIGSKLIFTHKDCKMRGCFRWVLWSVHRFLSQLISEHHPNKAVYAQDQCSQAKFWSTCRNSSEFSRNMDPARWVQHKDSDATGNLAQLYRKHISTCLHILKKSRAGYPQKVFSFPLLCNCTLLI